MTQQRLLITQGQHAVSCHRDVVLSTLLGSCVAVCLCDRLAGVGGMNHILIATQKCDRTRSNMVGTNAMELLINAMIKQGAKRRRMEAKVFGGAQMVDGLSDIGQENADFTLAFLQREGMPVKGHSLGGMAARQVLFWPVSGVVRIRTMPHMHPREVVRPPKLNGNGVELL